MNLYGFVGNNGVNQWDVLGLLDSAEALNHYKGGTRTAKRMSFDDIDTSSVKPSQFAKVQKKIDGSTSPRTVKIDDKLPFTTSGDQALFLGNITLRLQGDFTVKEGCKWEFSGTLKSYDDYYDFNASTHRGPIGELLTALGRNTTGKPYSIEIRGSKQISESGQMSQSASGGQGRGWY